jgi:hypothetical protein
LNLAASGTADVFLKKAVGASSAVGGLSVAAEHIEVVSVNAKKTGADSDHTGVISLKVAGGDTQDTAFDQDSQGKLAQAFRPNGTIKITGDLKSNGGDIVLGTTTPRSTTNILTFPSIIVDPATAGGTVNITGHNITMGPTRSWW